MNDTTQKGLWEKIRIGETTVQLQERVFKRTNAEKYAAQLREADPSRKYEVEGYEGNPEFAYYALIRVTDHAVGDARPSGWRLSLSS